MANRTLVFSVALALVFFAILFGGASVVGAWETEVSEIVSSPLPGERETQVSVSTKITESCSLYLPIIVNVGSSPKPYHIEGHVQKGPFILGSEISVRELDYDFVLTGRAFAGHIDDSTGHFAVRGTLVSPFVELAANGFYYNEVSGALSVAPISLMAVSDLSSGTAVNVNLLTHLEYARTLALVGKHLPFAAAKAQAQREVLTAFNLEDLTISYSEKLDISREGVGNAVLLAISTLLQGDRSEAQLTELLASVSNDLAIDGILDSSVTRERLLASVEFLKPRRAAVRANVTSRYAELGIPAQVPPFEDYAFALDTENPTVVSIWPNDGADTDISTIGIVFSELIQPETLNNGFIVRSATGNSMANVVAASEGGGATSATVIPVGEWPQGDYRLIVSTNIHDLAGNQLDRGAEIDFTHTPLHLLAASNSGPTPLLAVTTLTASIPGQANDITYEWSLGDGSGAVGNIVNHRYANLGKHNAKVTATHGLSEFTTSTIVTVVDWEIVGLFLII